MTHSVAIIIPARYASSRYPGKPLVPLRGASGESRSLIRRSWDAAQDVQGVDAVYIATDNDRIADHARMFGAEVIMTAEACRNGTERCADALASLPEQPDIIINLQGDAPLTPAWFVEDIIKAMRADNRISVATPGLRCDAQTHRAFLEDRAEGRVGGTTVVFDTSGEALYFSKEVIPYTGRTYQQGETVPVFHHVGLYGYTPEALKQYGHWAPGTLENLEGLEQLRFMENGLSVQVVEVEARGRVFWELNNPIDVPRIEEALIHMKVT